MRPFLWTETGLRSFEWRQEEELWDIFFQDDAAVTQSLFPVGWIHTHPAFDCFLSSVDIHNQYGYQVQTRTHHAVLYRTKVEHDQAYSMCHSQPYTNVYRVSRRAGSAESVLAYSCLT